jgi:hypothetical protein
LTGYQGHSELDGEGGGVTMLLLRIEGWTLSPQERKEKRRKEKVTREGRLGSSLVVQLICTLFPSNIYMLGCLLCIPDISH